MISLCVAITDNNTSALQLLLASLQGKMSLISEILVADFNHLGLARDATSEIDGVPVIQFKYDYPVTNCYAHAIGLHQCIRRAKNDCLITADHDVIILNKNWDKIFFDIFTDHNISMLGLQHYKVVEDQAFKSFPTVITAMLRKSSLPGPDFLDGLLKYRYSIHPEENDPLDDYPVQHENLFMIQTPIPSKRSLFPNPEGHFDTGCNFWIWATEQNWRWMAFKKKNGGPSIYTTNNVNNFGLKDSFGSQELLFHCGMHDHRQVVLRDVLDSGRYRPVNRRNRNRRGRSYRY